MKGFSQHHRFDDFDDFAATTRAWDLDLSQMDPGTFVGTLQQFGQSDFLIGHAHFSRSLLQRGAAPEGLRTFVIPTPRCRSLNWRRYDIDPCSLMVYAHSRDWESVSAPGFDIYTLSFSEDFLNRLCHDLELPMFQTLTEVTEVVRCPASRYKALVVTLAESLQSCLRQDDSDHDKERIVSHKNELATQILSLLSKPEEHVPIPPMRLRDRAVKRAVDYVWQTGRQPITLAELCREAKASERTLEYGFRERFGMTPQSYLSKHRLNGVHRQLRAGDPDRTRVADLANNWGFWHMGQFAADYRKLFGELPSETLGRNG